MNSINKLQILLVFYIQIVKRIANVLNPACTHMGLNAVFISLCPIIILELIESQSLARVDALHKRILLDSVPPDNL